MFSDTYKTKVQKRLRQWDLKPFATILTPDLIARAALRAGVAVGRGVLSATNHVWLALGGAYAYGRSFADVLGLVLRLVRDVHDDPFPQSRSSGKKARGKKARGKKAHARTARSKHDPHGTDREAVSEEAFVQARRRLPWSFWTALIVVLAERFERDYGPKVCWKHFRLLAIDGTCVNLPHWQRLIDFFGVAKGKKNATPRPQARLVALQFPLTRITCDCDVVPVTQSELSVAERLLSRLRRDDLVLMDRGFWSYRLFWQIQDQQAFFATRQKAGVALTTVRRLGRDDRLVRYARPKKCRKLDLPPAMELRVINYQVRGFRSSAVVTNVLDPTVVSRAEWVRLAAIDEAGRVLEPGLYHRRWEIETAFREMKSVQGLGKRFRGRTPESIRFEMIGQVLLHTLVHWLMVQAAAETGEPDPLRLSFSHAYETLLEMRETLLHARPDRVAEVLLPRLRQRIAAHRVPARPGRHYPRPHDTKPKDKGRGQYQPASKIT
jgi:hypothetical protein